MKIRKDQVAKGAVIGARTIGDIVKLCFKIIGTIFLIALTTGIIFTCIFAIYVKTSLATNLDLNLSDFSLDQTSVIYYWDEQTGSYKELASLYSDKNSSWVKYDEIPLILEHAVVAIEDKRFYDHRGVDWFRTVGAFGNMFLEMKDTFGGSTLTQQLIKNLTEYDDVTVKRKLLEIFKALEFEKNYSKHDIMEWYLNTSYFGEGCWGVGSAANVYYGKEVSELSLAECAALVGITNNPSMYDPYLNKSANKERQELILSEMLDQGLISQAEYRQAIREPLVFNKGNSTESTALQSNSWFVDAVIEDVIDSLREEKNISRLVASRLVFTAGYKIYATIDPEIQSMVDEVYMNREEMPSGSVKSDTQDLQSAIVVMDPYTGHVVALAGGFGEKEGRRIYNRATQAVRPPGSTIKPIASYAPALDLGYIKPYTTIFDGPNIKLHGTSWYPNNDDYGYRGLVTIRTAVQYSINTIAAQVMDLVTPQVSYEILTKKLGVSSLVENEDGFSDIDYAPLALGQLTNGISVREITAAYSCFPNKGIYTQGVTFTKIEDSAGNIVIDNTPDTNVAFSNVTAYYINDMLQNVVNAGTGYSARLSNMPVAGKTGASDSWRDRWFVGYTPYYVAAVWSGYDIPEYMGSYNPSAVLWQKVMSRVHENLEYKDFFGPNELDEHMRSVTVCIDTGKLATEICRNDVRGNHTMTLYMKESQIPSSSCSAHVWQEVCHDSLGLRTDTCPVDAVQRVGVLDLSRSNDTVLTPPYFTERKDYSYTGPLDSPDAPDPIEYVLTDLKACGLHNLDPVTGWYIDPNTGYLLNPSNRNIMYDTVNDKFYDKLSGKQVDPKTGYLIDPDTGRLINPWTGEFFTGTPDPASPDVWQRPPTYQPPEIEDPEESPPPDTSPSPEDPPPDESSPGESPPGESPPGESPPGETPVTSSPGDEDPIETDGIPATSIPVNG
jgi:penicillin-binding protein 1A